MRKSDLLFIFFLVILSSRDLSFKNLKIMMNSCMIKLKFLPKPDIIYILDEENFAHICCLFCIEFSRALLYTLWEVCHAFKIKITLLTLLSITRVRLSSPTWHQECGCIVLMPLNYIKILKYISASTQINTAVAAFHPSLY
jgi:hypothetical protein